MKRLQSNCGFVNRMKKEHRMDLSILTLVLLANVGWGPGQIECRGQGGNHRHGGGYGQWNNNEPYQTGYQQYQNPVAQLLNNFGLQNFPYFQNNFPGTQNSYQYPQNQGSYEPSWGSQPSYQSEDKGQAGQASPFGSMWPGVMNPFQSLTQGQSQPQYGGEWNGMNYTPQRPYGNPTQDFSTQGSYPEVKGQQANYSPDVPDYNPRRPYQNPRPDYVPHSVPRPGSNTEVKGQHVNHSPDMPDYNSQRPYQESTRPDFDPTPGSNTEVQGQHAHHLPDVPDYNLRRPYQESTRPDYDPTPGSNTEVKGQHAHHSPNMPDYNPQRPYEESPRPDYDPTSFPTPESNPEVNGQHHAHHSAGIPKVPEVTHSNGPTKETWTPAEIQPQVNPPPEIPPEVNPPPEIDPESNPPPKQVTLPDPEDVNSPTPVDPVIDTPKEVIPEDDQEVTDSPVKIPDPPVTPPEVIKGDVSSPGQGQLPENPGSSSPNSRKKAVDCEAIESLDYDDLLTCFEDVVKKDDENHKAKVPLPLDARVNLRKEQLAHVKKPE